jgi:hypothetical protein
MQLAPDKIWIATNQANGYLLSGQFEKAKVIYEKYAGQRLNPKQTFADAVLDDFAELRKAGIDHPDMAKIETLMKHAASPASKEAAPAAMQKPQAP